ncbi:NAD(P)/FAD-dependent oxidoreductase [Salibacterium aidingense]|uniref:NAD(P)/FAD-dependent oxidoreductase n=1 Tax=Salibacterium aidingense TaxID=384933 RepID=UPI003BC2D9FA
MMRRDVAVIGGGPAGLSAALVLGRALRDTILIDAQAPRNMVTASSHGFLTRDGISPFTFRRIANEELTAYETVETWKNTVRDIEKTPDGFTIDVESGKQIFSKKVILATGKKERLPSIQGFRDVFGKSVFVCPYCDGWERRGEPLAVFGSGEKVVAYASLVRNWSSDLVVFTNGEHLPRETRRELERRHIKVVEDAIAACYSVHGRLQSVQVENKGSITRTGGFIMGTGTEQSFELPPGLGASMNERNEYETDAHGRTNINGLYAIGDASHSFTGLVCAAGEGYEAAVHLNKTMIEEEWQRERQAAAET